MAKLIQNTDIKPEIIYFFLANGQLSVVTYLGGLPLNTRKNYKYHLA